MTRSKARFFPPGAVVETTTRVMQSRFLLRPSPEVNRTIIGILAKAQRRYGVEVHDAEVQSNHMHLLLSPRSQWRLSRFMGFVNGNIGRKVGRLQGWREKFWGRRYQPIVVADEEAQVARLRYLLAQGTKEGLIGSPRDWPSVSGTPALLDGSQRLYGTWTDQTSWYRAQLQAGRKLEKATGRRQPWRKVKERDFRTQEVLFLTPLPCWRDEDPAWVVEQIEEMVAAIEQETQQRHESQGTRPLGPKAILRQDPMGQPRKTKRSPAPLVHASTRESRNDFLERYYEFLAEYRAAAEALRRGVRDVIFPAGCFPPARPFVPAWDPG